MTYPNYVKTGTLLFLGQLFVGVTGWLYWLIISKLTIASVVGQATSIYSLVIFSVTLSMFGLEYTLLKKAQTDRTKILGTTLIIEIITILAVLPLVVYVIQNNYAESLEEFIWIALLILVFSSLSLVLRFSLLGILDAKTVLFLDIIGSIMKLVLGYFLVSNGFGTSGILLSFLIPTMFTFIIAVIIAKKSFSFYIGNFRYFVEIFRHGLVNTPSKLSRTTIVNLSVVLLASYGIIDSEIGVFYISLMISVIAGSFASSLSFMVIPSSSELKKDMSLESTRIGLGFTIPLITLLIVSPGNVLSLIGEEYVRGIDSLQVLAMSLIPYVILMNAFSKFNNLEEFKKLAIIGSIQLAVFLIGFIILVPTYGIFGAALSILVSFAISAIPCFFWIEKRLVNYLIIGIAAVFFGWLIHYTYSLFSSEPIMGMILPILGSSACVLKFKLISVSELKKMLKFH